MRLRRHRRDAEPDPISAFWAWWADARFVALRAVDTGDYGKLPDELSARVQAIDEGLEWEFAPGSDARHALTVSAAGVSALRPVAQRWLLAAPATDQDWEYRPARTASWLPDAVLEMHGHRIALEQLRIAIAPDHGVRISVALWSPAMGAMSEEERLHVAYMLLDWLLGEDVVEQWIGSIDAPTELPDGARPATAIPAYVAAHVAEVGPGSWTLLSGGTNDRPHLALVRAPQPRFEDLLRTDHVQAVLAYRHENEGGLPMAESLTALRAFEDAVESIHEGVAVLVGHETSAGRRVFHWYARDGQAAMIRLSLAVDSWDEGSADITTTADPGWDLVRHLR